jgi:CHAT domain-containing protein/tetratricopeptide (TPR) repeat protein
VEEVRGASVCLTNQAIMKKLLILAVICVALYPVAHAQVWKRYVDSANTYIAQGKADQAWQQYGKARSSITTGSPESDSLTILLKNLSQLFFRKDDRAQTIAAAKEICSLVLSRGSDMNLDYAWACNILGAVYNKQGKLDTAMQYHLKARDIREKLSGDQDLFYAQSCNNLGALYRDLGRFDEAEAMLLKAKWIREKNKLKSPAPFAITCTGLANLYRDMGQYEKAEALYIEAKNIRASIDSNSADYAASCTILADLYSFSYMGRPQLAENLYQEARGIIARLDSESVDFGQVCNNLASLYRDLGRYAEAEQLALKARSLFESNEDTTNLTINLNGLGELYYAMGRYREAETYFDTANRRWLIELGADHPFYIANMEDRARLFWKSGQVPRAEEEYRHLLNLKYQRLNKIFTFTSESEKQAYLDNIVGTNGYYQSFVFRQLPHERAGGMYTAVLLYRNLILSSIQDTRKTVFGQKDTTLVRIYGEWLSRKRQLANLYSSGSTSSNPVVKSIEEDADKLEKQIARISSGFEKTKTQVGWREIKKALQPGEAAIEFARFQLSGPDKLEDSILYVAMVLNPALAEPVLVPLCEERDLNQLLSPGAGDDAAIADQLYRSAQLYDLTWRPVQKYLAGSRKIYFAPAGNLFRLSFGAIPVNDHQVLSDVFELVQLNTTASVPLLKENRVSKNDRLRLYGGIDYDAPLPGLSRGSSFRYLPGTQKEILEIARLAKRAGIRVMADSGVRATKESVLALNDTRSPSLLHIATHGFFFEDPADDSLASTRRLFESSGRVYRESRNPLFRSGLVFAGGNNAWRGRQPVSVSNGILTAYEIANSLYLPNTRLVVLSACETARGQVTGSEGVYGLQRAFKLAGVSNLVMSLWKVPDVETSEFMELLYKGLFAGQSIGSSFGQAQRQLRNKYRNEPYKWAAWILVR